MTPFNPAHDCNCFRRAVTPDAAGSATLAVRYADLALKQLAQFDPGAPPFIAARLREGAHAIATAAVHLNEREMKRDQVGEGEHV